VQHLGEAARELRQDFGRELHIRSEVHVPLGAGHHANPRMLKAYQRQEKQSGKKAIWRLCLFIKRANIELDSPICHGSFGLSVSSST